VQPCLRLRLDHRIGTGRAVALAGAGRNAFQEHLGLVAGGRTGTSYGMSKMYALAQVSGLESNLSGAATRHDGTF
jgi:hypothetical protein